MSVQRPLNSKMSVRDFFVLRRYVIKKRLLNEILISMSPFDVAADIMVSFFESAMPCVP